MRRLLTRGDYLRIAILAVMVAVLSWLAVDHTQHLLDKQPLGIDFLPMWAAAHEAFAHPSRVYDFVALTRFQHPLLAGFRGLRPFVYPPSGLLVFAPFGSLPFVVANALWTGASLLLLLAAMAPLVKSARMLVLLLLVVSPASVLVMVTGQTTFLIATLVLVAMLNLRDRPILAGLLLGFAAAIKPPVLVLLPLALIAARQWRALLMAGATAAAVGLVSVAVFGVQAWLEWMAAMPRFERFIMHTPGLLRGVITPTGLGVSLGLHGDALMAWRAAFVVIGAVMVWVVFRRTEDPARRLAALLGGSLFVTPYAMHYDAALLAPAAVMLLAYRSSPGAWVTAFLGALLLCFAAIPHWGAAAVTAFVLLVALDGELAIGEALWRAAAGPHPQRAGAAAETA
ncbi:MAG: glycosyltransferase family 87 protein [Caulobacterales bacterium]